MPVELPLPVSAYRINAVDVANYTALWNPADLEALHQAGVFRLIVGASYGSVARPQLEAACTDERFDTQAYLWVSFKDLGTAAGAVDRAYQAVAGLPVSRMWLDIEEPTNLSSDDVLNRIQWVVDRCKQTRADLPLGIYTAGWWWRPHTRDSGESFGLPLFYADYRTPEFLWEQGDAFGGWHENEVHMKQFAGTVQTCGLNTDQSTITEYDPMIQVYTKQETDAKVGALLGAIAHQGDIITALGGGVFGLAEHVYGSTDPKVAALQAKLDEWNQAATAARGILAA